MTKFKISDFVWIILCIVSFGALIISSFKLPNTIYYFADACNILLFIFAVKKSKINDIINSLTPFIIILSLFIFSCIIGVVINSVPLILSLWGARNFFRYILFFFSCILILRKKHIQWFLKQLPKIYWLNFILSLFQYAVLHLGNDYIGGIFGIAQGCNGSTTIFLNICIAYFVSEYLNKRINLLKLGEYTIAYFIITVLTEIKGNYIFFVLIVAVELIFGRKSRRSIIIGISSVFVLIFGIYLLSVFFPESVNTLLDFDAATNYMNASYFGKVTFTRNAIFDVANKYFFKNNGLLYLFGYGLGACDVSAFFSSPFYSLYGSMNYRQYSMAMMLLQNGYVGLALYLGMFVFIGIVSLKQYKNDKNDFDNSVFLAVTAIVVFALLNNIYASLLVDMGYWIWFMMAVPFILKKKT